MELAFPLKSRLGLFEGAARGGDGGFVLPLGPVRREPVEHRGAFLAQCKELRFLFLVLRRRFGEAPDPLFAEAGTQLKFILFFAQAARRPGCPFLHVAAAAEHLLHGCDSIRELRQVVP